MKLWSIFNKLCVICSQIKTERQMLLIFFATCNKIGAFTLGGGYAMIPIMEREFVDKNKWMDNRSSWTSW